MGSVAGPAVHRSGGDSQIEDGGPRQVLSLSSLASLTTYRRDVQVLRGLAVLAVVLYHCGRVVPGGYVGVDVFFVISGFVIGRVLVRSFQDEGGGNLWRFYVRRVLRLLPALALMLSVVLLVAPLLAPVGALPVTAATGRAAAMFNANVHLYRTVAVGYFGPAASLNPLLHTWSLAVEEQFYIVLPPLLSVVWWLGRRSSRPLRAARWAVGLLVVSSFAACISFSYTARVWRFAGLRFAFFSPVTRAWEFGLGLGLVLLPRRAFRSGPWAQVCGAVTVGASMALLSDATPFPGWASLLPAGGTAVLLYGGTAPWRGFPRVTRALSRPFVWLGDCSYGWYLWHLPLIVFAGALRPPTGRPALLAAAGLALVPAWLSTRVVEGLLRRRLAQVRPGWIAALALCCVAAPLGAASLSVRLDAKIAQQAGFGASAAGLARHAAEVAGCHTAVPLGERPPGGCSWGVVGGDPVLLIGDSNAGHFSEGMIGASATGGARLTIATSSDCPFIDAEVRRAGVAPEPCRRFVAESLAFLEHSPPRLVVIASATDAYVNDGAVSIADSVSGYRATDAATKAVAFEVGLERLVRALRSAGSRVAVINDVPKPGMWDPRACSYLSSRLGYCHPAPFALSGSQSVREANAIEDRASAAGGGEVWNVNASICPADRCRGQRNHAPVWRDSGHISVPMSTLLAEPLEAMLTAAVRR